MDLSDAKRLKQLEDENARLKRLLSDAMLDRAIVAPLVRAQWRGSCSRISWENPADADGAAGCRAQGDAGS